MVHAKLIIRSNELANAIRDKERNEANKEGEKTARNWQLATFRILSTVRPARNRPKNETPHKDILFECRIRQL